MENKNTTDDRDLPSISPDQLLKCHSYAVVCYVDGEFTWLVDIFHTLEVADQVAKECRENTRYDHRVVRIEHAK